MEILFAVLWWPNATREASTALISIAEKNAFIDSSSNILSKFKQIVAKSPKPTQLVGRTAKATCCRCLDLWFLSSMQYILDKCSWQKVMSSVKRFGPSRFAGLSNSVMVIWPLPSASILPHHSFNGRLQCGRSAFTVTRVAKAPQKASKCKPGCSRSLTQDLWNGFCFASRSHGRVPRQRIFFDLLLFRSKMSKISVSGGPYYGCELRLKVATFEPLSRRSCLKSLHN